MKLVLFHQYDQLLAKIREVARCCARDAADWKICRVSASNGSVHLHDRAMNVLSVSGGETRIVVPDIEPERANIPQTEGLPRSGALAGVQFCLRVTADGDNTLTFTGAEAFEAANADALLPPSDGQTVIYRFTEIVEDRLYVERMEVGYVN